MACKAIKRYNQGGKVYRKDHGKNNVLTSKTKRYEQEGLKGDTRSLTKTKARGSASNTAYKKKVTTYDEGVGTVTKEKRTSGGKRKYKTREISGNAAHRAIKGGMGKRYAGGGKVVAQGADKKDVRREKKQDRMAAKAKRVGDRNFKRDVKSGKLKRVGAAAIAGAMAGAKAGVKKRKA